MKPVVMLKRALSHSKDPEGLLWEFNAEEFSASTPVQAEACAAPEAPTGCCGEPAPGPESSARCCS